MVASLLSRLILLALLPVIALLFFLEGQSYDPALIRFSASPAHTGMESALFPREVSGFIRSGNVRLYSKDNLYEYVNGHAEYFIAAGFAGLAVGEYIRIGTEPDQPDIVVDIYDMGESLHAFGVFTDEAGNQPAAPQFGMIGARTAQGVSFANGKYYIKITSFQNALPIDDLAERIDLMIGASPEESAHFLRLPDLQEVVSTRFVKEAYRGLDFVNNVVEREYRVEGKTMLISLVTGSNAEMKKLTSSYRAFFRDSDIPFEEMEEDGHDVYRIMDPYEGVWHLILLPDAVFGVYGEVDDEMLNLVRSSIMRSNSDKAG